MYEVGQHVIIKQGCSLPHIDWVSGFMDKYVGVEAVIVYAEKTFPFGDEQEVYTLHKLNGDDIKCWWADKWLMPADYEVDEDSLNAINDFMSDFG